MYPLPTSLEEVGFANQRIAELLRQIRMHELTFNARRAEIEKEETGLLKPLVAEIIAIGKSIFQYAEEHRDELTEGEKRRTVILPKAGSLQWYRTPLSVQIKKSEEEEVLKRLKMLNLLHYIRTKEEINREALLENSNVAPTIQGITIVRQDKFAIRPPHTNERLECNTETKRWKIVVPKSSK